LPRWFYSTILAINKLDINGVYVRGLVTIQKDTLLDVIIVSTILMYSVVQIWIWFAILQCQYWVNSYWMSSSTSFRLQSLMCVPILYQPDLWNSIS